MDLLLATAIVFALLVGAELRWRRGGVHGEFSRKFVHLTVGSFVAFWPYFLSWDEIRFLSGAFLVVVVISQQLKLFRAIHSVQRPTWGEVLFAVAVGALTFVTDDKAVYAAALLQMSMADGLAAVVGVRYGKNNSYSVFGHKKSVAGTITFFFVSLAVLLWLTFSGAYTLSLLAVLGIAATASAIENLAVKGWDNLVVPLSVGLLLTHLL